jgi:hypothetical protein
MRAVCMVSHERRPLAYLRNWRVGEGVEEVVFGQDEFALDAFRIDVLVRLKRLLETSTRCRREATTGKRQFRRRWVFGGMVPL